VRFSIFPLVAGWACRGKDVPLVAGWACVGKDVWELSMFDAFWLGNTDATVIAPEFTNRP